MSDMLKDAFTGVRGVSVSAGRRITLELPKPAPMHEPNDMVIVEPPGHRNEPVKIPAGAEMPIFCLVCGEPFAA